jgi:putative ABC transport system ATP-binding protein
VAGLPASPEPGGRGGGPGPAVRLEGVCRAYPTHGEVVWAVREVSLQLAPCDAVAVTGPSGSGKTTLLNLVAGLDRPSAGTVAVLGRRLDRLREHELTAFRAASVGLVFQDPHLLPGLTAVENVVVARLPWQPRRELEPKARELLAAVGLERRMDHPPARLSGGERQRVAVARALVGGPPLLLADEPTGYLDAAGTEALLALLERLRRALRLTTVIATHDPAVAAIADRVVRLVDGRVVGDHATGGRAPLDLHALE